MVALEMVNKTGSRTVDLLFRPSMKCNTVDGIHAIVRLGLGAAILPEFTIADDLEAGHLVRLLPGYAIAPKPINAVHAYDTRPPKSLLSFIELVGGKLPQ